MAKATFDEFGNSNGVVGAGEYRLLQNIPNPFNSTTAIGFVLPESCEAQLRVFDAAGRLLAERRAHYPAGKHEETFDLNTLDFLACKKSILLIM